MTPDEYAEVDIDLLADYIGGALAGADEARVARIVAEDPRWRSAYEIVAPALAATEAELHAFGAAPEPMPADVVARLESALAAAHAEPAGDGAATGRRLVAVPDRGDDRLGSGRTRATAARRRRMRWAAPVAAAAGVLAFAGFGVGYLVDRSGTGAGETSSAADSSAGNAPMIASDQAERAGLVIPPGADQIIASGIDYTPATLPNLSARAAGEILTKPDAVGKGAPRGTQVAPDPGIPELQRLRARPALLACLGAIARENADGPITVQAVDFARFQGRPALIVQFTTARGGSAWASGADCGTSGSDRLA
jgi:hypothetical protein